MKGGAAVSPPSRLVSRPPPRCRATRSTYRRLTRERSELTSVVPSHCASLVVDLAPGRMRSQEVRSFVGRVGGVAGDGGHRFCAAEDGDQAQGEQGTDPVAAASDPARVGHLVQHVGQCAQVGQFDERAWEVNVLVVAREGVDQGRWHTNATPVHDLWLREP